jgi:hypothetical protein
MTNDTVKCRFPGCKRTSRNPKAEVWGYVQGGAAPDLVGWWCPKHAKGLMEHLKAIDGIKETVEAAN